MFAAHKGDGIYNSKKIHLKADQYRVWEKEEIDNEMQGIVACFPKTDLVNPMLYEALRATGNGLCSVREQESTEASLCLRDQKISKGEKEKNV